MNNEETIFENEKTQFDSAKVNQQEAKGTTNQQSQPAKKDSAFTKAAVGMGLGIVLGTTTSFVSSKAFAGNTPSPNEPSNDTDGSNITADSTIEMSDAVNDDMSFSEAFAAAREDVGSGGAFEWRGNIYSTYYEEEWENMSEEERAEYQSHFSSEENTDDVAEAEAVSNDEQEELVASTDFDDEGADVIAETDVTAEEDLVVEDELTAEVEVVDSEDVEILGVVHDDDTGFDVGVMSVDGQDVFLVDVETDGVFDVMAVDANNDGELSLEEMVDIHNEGIAVNQFEEASDSYYAMNDDTLDYTDDYTNDADIMMYDA